MLPLFPDSRKLAWKSEELSYALTKNSSRFKTQVMTFREIKKRLLEAGWQVKDQKGSHVHMIHPSKPGKITIPNHGKKDLKLGTVNAIWKNAGLGN